MTPQTNYAEVSLRAESKLTERSQTTIPAAIRDALHLKPGEYIRYELLAGGQVVLSRLDEEEEQDPVVASFLHFLEKDMQNNPQRLRSLSPEKLARARELTAGMDLDIDAEITDED